MFSGAEVINISYSELAKEFGGRFSNRSDKMDILAPVGNRDEKGIYCLRPTAKSGNGAGTGHGTSYAAPQVAATAALRGSHC